MEPRLKASKKWTSLPAELLNQVTQVFHANFKEEAKSGKFIIVGRVYSTELLLSIGYLEKGRLRQINFLVSIEFDPKKQNALKLIYSAVDCAAAMMTEYFKLGELDEFPKEWQELDFDGQIVFICTSMVNTELESKADQILGIAEESLVQGEDEKLDTDVLKATLGIDPEED